MHKNELPAVQNLYREGGGLEMKVVYNGPNIGQITRRFYAEGKPLQTVLTQSYTWDSRHRLQTATDENGTLHRYSYDGLGRLTRIQRQPPGPLVPNETLQEIEYYLSASATGTYIPATPNYIRTTTYQTGSVTDVATVYFDGLGREIQTQQLVEDGSGSVRDSVAVAFPEYDTLGRPHRQWLPVGMRLPSSVDADHGFIPITTVKTEAELHYADHPGNGTGANNRPYSETTYEASPLSRPITEQAPGAPTTVSGGSGSVVANSYGVAAPGEGTTDPMAYTEIRDEDNRWTRTYTDGLGRERFSVRGQGTTEEARTGFVYDAADRLLVVRPPNYYKAGLDILRHLWETVYTVNTRGLVLTKTTPDTRNTALNAPGTFRYKYDTSGRLRYSQDPEQRALGQVSYVRYDALDRPVYSGVGRPLPCAPGAGNPEACWSELNPDSDDPIIRDVLAPMSNDHWEWLGGNRRTQYAYDDTTNTHGWPFYIDTLVTQHYLAGRPAAVAHKVEGQWDVSPVRWQTSQLSYNTQSLVAERRERIRHISASPWDLFTYTYNRAGMLTQDRVTVGTSTLRHQYQYDRRGLLTTVGISHATSGAFSQILALDYDIAGAVINRHLGTGGGQTAVPYAYDVAGRIHEIGDVDRVINPDPFAARYSYTASGLISRMDTRSGAAAQNCSYSADTCTSYWRYTFSYDALARLTGATYRPVAHLTRYPGYTVSNISYDAQGNIETLIRNAPTSANPDGTPVDNLTYTYTPRTNRLTSVADAVTTDFDWDARPTSFVYNRVGSVTWTTEELTPTTYRETEIQIYDERQLPEELRIRLIATPGGAYDSTMVSYRYDVNGQRIRKQIRETAQGPDVVYERYVRDGMRLVGVFGEDNELKNWNIGGTAGLVGRAEPATLGFTRRFYVSDHLGSIRAVVNQSGTVIEGRDYYPYGLTMPGRFYVASDTTREGFTGHELDPETGDYYAGARFYNPALGRFLTTDRFQDMYPGLSPYQYGAGNPVLIIDVNGDSLAVHLSSVMGSRFYHAAIVHHDEVTGSRTVLAEGMPENRSSTSDKSSMGSGYLIKSIETNPYENNLIIERIPIPEGMTEPEFVDSITRAYEAYDNSVEYQAIPLPTVESINSITREIEVGPIDTGNSNSLVGSVLREAGSNFQPSVSAPGWEVDVLPQQRLDALDID